MYKIVELTETQLGLLVEHRAQFERLHVGGKTCYHAPSISHANMLGLVKKNMGKSNEAGSELSAIMLSKTPESIKAESVTLDQRRVAAFKKATAAFEGAVGGEDQDGGEDDSD